MSSVLRAILLVLAVVTLTACTNKPVYNPDRTLPPTVHADHEQMKQAILATLAQRKWTVQRVDPDKIQAEITVRNQFHAEIDIDYTTTHYTIIYRDSQALNYKDGKIHKNYNRWVRLLDKGILRELRGDQPDANPPQMAGTPQTPAVE